MWEEIFSLEGRIMRSRNEEEKGTRVFLIAHEWSILHIEAHLLTPD